MPPKPQEALFAATMLLFERAGLACAPQRDPAYSRAGGRPQRLAGGISGMIDPKAKILVVDDVAENRDLLLRRLTRLGFSLIDQATNGVEALAALGEKSYDLVLLDIMMPELDGFGVLEALRADGRINDLPVIVISALDEVEPVVRCIELGAADFIVKPFNPTLLRARVLTTLEKKALTDRTRDGELKRKQYELNEARTLQLALVHAAVCRKAVRPVACQSTSCSNRPRKWAATWSIISASATTWSCSRSATCPTRAPAPR